jgi:hypothetical protein
MRLHRDTTQAEGRRFPVMALRPHSMAGAAGVSRIDALQAKALALGDAEGIKIAHPLRSSDPKAGRLAGKLKNELI